MRWYKHMTNSHNDERLAEIVHEFGLEGYGFWWLLLEIVGKEMDSSDRCFLSYPLATWARKMMCSKRKTSAFFEKFSEISLICLEYDSENTVGKLRVHIPNLLKYRDEYSKKSGQTPDKKQKESGAKKQIADTQTETETEKPLQQRLSRQQVKDLLIKYAGVLQVNSGQWMICSEIADNFTAEAITESFQAAAAAGIGGKGFLGWCKARMERRKDPPEPDNKSDPLAAIMKGVK